MSDKSHRPFSRFVPHQAGARRRVQRHPGEGSVALHLLKVWTSLEEINVLTTDVRSLNIDPRSVDVNVHPTKKEVHFLNEDVIIERIADTIQKSLIGQSQSRVFEY